MSAARHNASAGRARRSECTHCHSDDRRQDREAFPVPPGMRRPRGRPLIPDIPGLSEWMEEQFEQEPRPSFREIEERLRATEFWPKILAAGFRTGKSSIYTHYVRWHAESARKRVVSKAAAIYNASSTPGDILEIETAISGLANVAIFEDLQQELSEGRGISEKAGALIELHRKLQTSSAQREKERRAAGVSTRKAYDTARAEIVTILENNPEALHLVLAAIDNAQHGHEASPPTDNVVSFGPRGDAQPPKIERNAA